MARHMVKLIRESQNKALKTFQSKFKRENKMNTENLNQIDTMDEEGLQLIALKCVLSNVGRLCEIYLNEGSYHKIDHLKSCIETIFLAADRSYQQAQGSRSKCLMN